MWKYFGLTQPRKGREVNQILLTKTTRCPLLPYAYGGVGFARAFTAPRLLGGTATRPALIE